METRGDSEVIESHGQVPLSAECAMLELLRSFLTVLHVMLRGDSHVQTEVTTNEYSYTHRLPRVGSGDRLIVFHCKQYKHTTRFERWYMPRRIYYTYTVEMVRIDDDQYHDYHMGHYPHLCAKWLHSTTFPLLCAVNAHIDMLNHYAV